MRGEISQEKGDEKIWTENGRQVETGRPRKQVKLHKEGRKLTGLFDNHRFDREGKENEEGRTVCLVCSPQIGSNTAGQAKSPY